MTPALRGALVGAMVAACAALGGCGADSSGPSAVLRSADSSWVAGQLSPSAFPGFLGIETRAESLAAKRFAERQRELALIEAARIAAKKRQKAAQLQAYLEAKRRAEAAYRAALRHAAIERRRALAKLRALQRKRAAELRKLRAKLRVPPGEECSDPLVRRHVSCRAGSLPLGHR